MLLETMDAEKKALAKRLAKELKKHPLLVLEGDHFTNGRKIAYLTLFLGTGIYRQCVRAEKKFIKNAAETNGIFVSAAFLYGFF